MDYTPGKMGGVIMSNYLKTPVTKEMLEEALRTNPAVTQKELAHLFGCGTTTIGRFLTRFGLSTKDWTERKHSDKAKKQMSDTRIRKGVAKGVRNPNFGERTRPWLDGDDAPFKKWHREHPDFGNKQKGAANPIHKVMHLYEDPQYVERITRGLKKHVDQKRGSTYDDVYGPEKALEYRQKLRAASPARMAKFGRKETEPEKTVRSVLVDLGICFECQHPLGFYTVDFFIPSVNVVIQADGDYWHGNPLFYGLLGKPLSKIQRKTQRLDASCDSFLLNHGFKILRLWEHDLKWQLENCIQKIKEVINV